MFRLCVGPVGDFEWIYFSLLDISEDFISPVKLFISRYTCSSVA